MRNGNCEVTERGMGWDGEGNREEIPEAIVR